MKIIDILGTKDPWAGLPCSREDYWSCRREGNEGKGQIENVTYRISCLGCLKNNVIADYTGESSRTLYCRGAEHEAALRDEDERSPLWKHSVLHHQGEKQEFKLELLSRHYTAFSRQVTESVFITNGVRDICLNSKSEWNGDAIPRLTIEVRDRVDQKDHGGQKLTQQQQLNPGKRPQKITTKDLQATAKRTRVEIEPNEIENRGEEQMRGTDKQMSHDKKCKPMIEVSTGMIRTEPKEKDTRGNTSSPDQIRRIEIRGPDKQMRNKDISKPEDENSTGKVRT